MPIATNAAEQLQAMENLIARGLQAGPLAQLKLAADLMAAQMTLNHMIVEELREMKKGTVHDG